VAISNSEGKTVLPYDASIGPLTENAFRHPLFVLFRDASKVGVVTISFRRITGLTKGLKIEGVINTTVIPWDNVIHFESLFFRRSAAQFTSEFGSFQNLIA
jgi:hypothetical protein